MAKSYEDLRPGQQRRYDRRVSRRDEAGEGTAQWNRMQNKINRMTGSDKRYDRQGDVDTDYQGSIGGDSHLGDISSFDVNNKFDVMALQRQLFPNDESQWDGKFGPKTEEAYRTMLNSQRVNKGLDSYMYDEGFDPLTDAYDNAKNTAVTAGNKLNEALGITNTQKGIMTGEDMDFFEDAWSVGDIAKNAALMANPLTSIPYMAGKGMNWLRKQTKTKKQ